MKMQNKQKKELISNYYNGHYKHVNSKFDTKSYRKEILINYESFINKSDKILDLGCGTGFLLRVLENEGYSNLWGVERDKYQFEEAKKILKISKIYHQDIFDFFKENNQKFNVIFLMDVIEHISKEKVISMLKLIYDHLDKKSVLIIRTPNAESPLFCGRMRYNDITHEIAYNQNSIKMILREAGFIDIICKPTRFNFNSLRLLLSGIIRILGNFILRTYLASYLGIDKVMKMILTPNFITIAKK